MESRVPTYSRYSTRSVQPATTGRYLTGVQHRVLYLERSRLRRRIMAPFAGESLRAVFPEVYYLLYGVVEYSILCIRTVRLEVPVSVNSSMFIYVSGDQSLHVQYSTFCFVSLHLYSPTPFHIELYSNSAIKTQSLLRPWCPDVLII